MTEEQRIAKRDSLLQARQSELYSNTIDQWLANSEISYSGVVLTMEQLEAAAAADAAAAVAAE